MNRSDEVYRTLWSLDPAERHIDPTNPRARADLEAIVATDPASPFQEASSPAPARVRRTRRPARTTRRLALVGGFVAVVAAAVVMLPSLTGGDEAFATWSAAPVGVPAQQRPAAATDCRENMEDVAGAEYADDLARAEPAIAERRGVWTTVVLAGTDGFTAMCITDDSSHRFSKAMIGSIGAPTASVTPGPREVVATDLGVGSMHGRDISLASGHAGSHVAEVVYPSQMHGNVAATVSDGRFALWMPGDELEGASSNGVEVEVSYHDGTTDTEWLSLS